MKKSSRKEEKQFNFSPVTGRKLNETCPKCWAMGDKPYKCGYSKCPASNLRLITDYPFKHLPIKERIKSFWIIFTAKIKRALLKKLLGENMSFLLKERDSNIYNVTIVDDRNRVELLVINLEKENNRYFNFINYQPF